MTLDIYICGFALLPDNPRPPPASFVFGGPDLFHNTLWKWVVITESRLHLDLVLGDFAIHTITNLTQTLNRINLITELSQLANQMREAIVSPHFSRLDPRPPALLHSSPQLHLPRDWSRRLRKATEKRKVLRTPPADNTNPPLFPLSTQNSPSVSTSERVISPSA